MPWLVRPRVAFVAALVVLLPVHLHSVVQDSWFQQPPQPTGDGLDYENIGYHLWQGSGYALRNKDPNWLAIYESQADIYRQHLDAPARDMLTTGRPPALPTVIAGFYCLLGRTDISFAAIRLFSGFCLALSGAISAWLTARLLLPDTTLPTARLWSLAAFAGVCMTIAMAAAQRTLKSYAHDFLTEPLALLLMQAFVLLVLEYGNAPAQPELYRKSQRFRIATLLAGCGVIFGLLILTRSIFVVWIPGIACLWFLASQDRGRVAVVRASVVVAVILLCCLPWWIRNVAVLNAWMPLGTQGPITLLGAYSDESLAAGGDWRYEPEQRLRRQLAADPSFAQLPSDEQREVHVATAAKAQVQQWIRSHLIDLPGLFVSRVVTHWNPYTGSSLVWKLLALLGAAWLLGWRPKDSVTGSADSEDSSGSNRRETPVGGAPAADLRLPARCWLIGLPLLSTLVSGCLYTTGGRFLVPLYGVLFSLGGIGFSIIVGWLLSTFTERHLRMMNRTANTKAVKDS